MSKGHIEAVAHVDDVKMGSDRSFGLVFATVFTLIGLWPTISIRPLPRLELDAARLWALVIALGFLAAALLFPAILKSLNWAWFKFGLAIGRVMNPIVMGILFFAVVTPMGLLMRALGKDLLRLKLDREAPSYWIRRETPSDPDDHSMKNQY